MAAWSALRIVPPEFGLRRLDKGFHTFLEVFGAVQILSAYSSKPLDASSGLTEQAGHLR